MRKIFFIYTYYQKNDPVANSSLFELFFLEASHFSEDSYAEKSKPITSNNEANILLDRFVSNYDQIKKSFLYYFNHTKSECMTSMEMPSCDAH